MALGLATFAVAAESVATVNRDTRARADIGASRVAALQFDPGVDPVGAVHRADPSGKWAMTGATFLPDGGGSVVGTVLAVDADRLATTGYQAAGGPSLAAVANQIGTSAVPTVVVTGTYVRVTVIANGLSPGPVPDVQLNLRSVRKPYLDVSAGPLRAGTHDYTAAVACSNGCIWRGLTWDRPAGVFDVMTGTVLVSRLQQGDGRTWRDVAARLTDAAAWREGSPRGDATDTINATSQGLRSTYRSTGGGSGALTYASVPSPLPVVGTPNGITPDTGSSGPLQMQDAGGAVATYTVRSTARVLPVVLDNGLLVDLSFLRAQLPDFDSEAVWSVWLGPNAPADAVARLTAAGLAVESQTSTASRIDLLSRQGPALSLVLLLGCAIAGAVLAVGSVVIAVSASGRRRSFEIAALRAVGVPRRPLLRASVLEELLLLGAAVVLGVPAGIVAAHLAMPAIPQFSDATPITLSYTPSAAVVSVFVLSFMILLLVTSVVAALAVIRVAVPAKLRSAEE
ncbi:MAG: FtsX-like permease family protein [Chloroflexi bacterium]|nr:FtsX-like permease family protein [Chloroflexota bacterium]